MVKNKKFLIGYKLFFSFLGFSALVTEVATLAERGRFDAVNFFSYFTVENNILICIAFLLSALAIASKHQSRAFDIFRGFTTMLIILVGIGFLALLSGLKGVALTAVPWDNIVLHYIIPVAAFIDILIDRPKTRFSFKRSLAWLGYPLAYVVYTLVRGAMTGWYPYPFINPDLRGYVSVGVAIFELLVLGLILVWVVTKLSGKKQKTKA